MAGHTVPGPLQLADPAPVEATARLGADHVHAAAVPLCGGPTAGAGLGDDPDGDRAGVHCSPPGQRWSVLASTELGCLTGRVRGGQTGPQVSSLPAVSAEHEATVSTAHPPAVLLSLTGGLEEDAGPTARLGTEHAARLEHHLLSSECEIPGPE